MHERAGADDLTRWDRLHLLRLHYVKTAAECPCREFSSFQVRKISRISSSIGSLAACLDQRRGEFQRRGESGLLLLEQPAHVFQGRAPGSVPRP